MTCDYNIASGAPVVFGSGAISFTQFAETASDIVMITGPNLDSPGPMILYVNPAFTRLTGYTAAESVGRAPRFLQGPGTSRAVLDTIGSALREAEPVCERLLNYAKGGTPYWIDLRIVALRDPVGSITQFAAIERDVTLEQRRLDELVLAVVRDPLTGMLNRRGFMRVIEAELEVCQVLDGARSLCVAFIDVDSFKHVNDELGHSAGDAILCGIADRLADHIRRSDTLGRIGGDEFAVCFPGATLHDCESLAEQLRRAVADEPFPTSNGPVTVTVSIGVVAFADGDNLTALMQRTDAAMYKSKRDGRNRVTAVITTQM
jgi:diguanylate cyclase (GGDEF)-like protein/PAS domain S-box-containing protein